MLQVIDAYGAMLTEMHKMVSGRAEYVGTSYIYTSVCLVCIFSFNLLPEILKKYLHNKT